MRTVHHLETLGHLIERWAGGTMRPNLRHQRCERLKPCIWKGTHVSRPREKWIINNVFSPIRRWDCESIDISLLPQLNSRNHEALVHDVVDLTSELIHWHTVFMSCHITHRNRSFYKRPNHISIHKGDGARLKRKCMLKLGREWLRFSEQENVYCSPEGTEGGKLIRFMFNTARGGDKP